MRKLNKIEHEKANMQSFIFRLNGNMWKKEF